MKSNGLNGNGLTSSRRQLLSFLLLAIFYITQRECEAFHTHPSCQTRTSSSSLRLLTPEHADIAASFLPTISLASSSITTHSTPNILDSYGELLRTYPLTTKAATAGILSTAGDAIAQYSAAAKTGQQTITYDVKRGLTFGLFGVTYTGVFQHYWFPYLASHVSEWGHLMHIWGDGAAAADGGFFQNGYVSDAPPGSFALAAGKVVINQVLMIPGLYMPIFLILTSLLGGLDWEQAKARASSLYFPLVRRNWLFWFPTQFFQFFAIPSEWHIPFLSTASLVWTIILSTVGSAAASTPQPPAEDVSDNVVDEVTGTDTIRVVDVVQNALGRQILGGETEQSILGATTTVLLVLLLVETADGFLESSVESAEELQALFIATAGWIGWTLGPKFATTTIEYERPELAMARIPFQSLQHALLKSDARLEQGRTRPQEEVQTRQQEEQGVSARDGGR